MSDPGDAGNTGDRGTGNLNFRYNRDRRLENAPEIVRETYRRGYTPNKGFIKGLTANAGMRSVFFAILLLSAVIVGVSLFGTAPDTVNLSGVKVRSKAFLYGDSVFVTIALEPVSEALPQDDSAPVPVNAVIDGLGSSGEVLASQEVGGIYAGAPLNVRAALRDYELDKIRVRLRFGESVAELAVSVDRD